MVLVDVVEVLGELLEGGGDIVAVPRGGAVPQAGVGVGAERAEEDVLHELRRGERILGAEGDGRDAGGLQRVGGGEEVVGRHLVLELDAVIRRDL